MSEPPAGPDAGRISRRHFLGLGAAGLGAALLMSRAGRRRRNGGKPGRSPIQRAR